MKKKTILLFFFAIAVTICNAQNWEWVKNYGSAEENETCSETEIDSEGNIYVTGTFSGILTIGAFSVESEGSHDIYIAKYNNDGDILWLRSSGAKYNYASHGIEITSNGDYYIMGSYSDAFSLVYFVKRYSITGELQWTKQVNNNNTHLTSEPGYISIDSEENCYIAGTFYGNLYTGIESLNSGDFWAAFFVKYNKEGKGLSCEKKSNPPTDIHVNSIDEFVSAHYSNMYKHNVTIETDEWSLRSGGVVNLKTSMNTKHHITTDIDNNIFLAVNQKAPYRIGSITAYGVKRADIEDHIYEYYQSVSIWKIDANKQVLWAKEILGTNDCVVNSIQTDSEGSVYVAGQYEQNIAFDDFRLKSEGRELFIAKYNTNGEFQWAVKAGSGVDDMAYSISIDNNDNVFVAGQMLTPAYFGSDSVVGSGGIECFLAKLNCLPPQPSEIEGDTLLCIEESQYSVTENPGITYNWELSSGGTITAEANTVTVNWTETGFHTLKVTPSGECGEGEERTLEIEVRDVPKQPELSGDTIVCIGNEAYSIESKEDEIYYWDISGGGKIHAIENTAIVNWLQTGEQILSVQAENMCGLGEAKPQKIEINTIPQHPGVVSGNTDVCAGQQTYSIVKTEGIEYNWSMSSGGTISVLENKATVNWTEAGQHLISVIPSNHCGLGEAATLSATITKSPSQPSAVTGDKQICIGMQTYSVIEMPDVDYNWTINGGGAISALDASAEIEWTTPGTYQISVTPSNKCGEGNSRLANINVTDIPAQPETIIGISDVCKGAQTYITPDIQGVSYSWSLSGGGTIMPNGNSVLIDWQTAGVHTLTVTPYNFCGTGASKSVLVTVRDIAEQVNNIEGVDLVCIESQEYTVPLVDGLSYLWTLTDGGTLSSSGNTATVNWTTTGIHNIILSTSDGCTKSLPVEVGDIPLTPSEIKGEIELCEGSYNYSVPRIRDVDYSWQISGGGVLQQSVNTASVDWKTPGNYTIAVTPENRCGTGEFRSLSIEMKDIPETPQPISGKETSCIELETYSTTLANDVEYFWTLSGHGLIFPDNNKADIVWSEIGEATVSVSATNICGSSAAQTLKIEINQLPDKPNINGEAEVCVGETNYTLITQPNVTYEWNVSAGELLAANNQSATINWTSAGLYTFSVTPTNQCGEGETAVFQVKVKDIPSEIIEIEGEDLVCQGVNAYQVLPEDETAYNWQLSGGGSITALGNAATINWTKGGEHTLTITPSNKCGNAPSTSKTVTVKEIPQIMGELRGITDVCMNSELYSISPLENVEYNWILDDGGELSESDNSATVNWTESGIHTISVFLSNMCGSGSAKELTVNVKNVPPKPDFILKETNVCFGANTYSVKNTDNANYNWALSGGGELNTANNSAVINWNTKGNHVLQVTPSNSCGNGQSATLSITVDNIPDKPSSIIGSQTVCLGETNYNVNNVQNVNYQWSVSGGGNFTSDKETALLNWITPGNHTITVTPNNSCGEGQSQQLLVTVLDIPNQPSLISGSEMVCSQTEKQYFVTSVPNTIYSWNLSDGGSLVPELNTANVNWLQSGEHLLKIIPSNICGVGASRNLTIKVNTVPDIPLFTKGNTEVCLGEELYRVNSSSGASYNWKLSSGGSIETSNNTAIVDWNAIGVYTVNVTPSNFCGNGRSNSLIVRVNDIPNKPTEISGSTKTCIGIENYYISKEEGIHYQWALSSGGSISAENSSANIEWLSKGNHILSVTPSNICGTGQIQSIKVAVNDIPQQAGQIYGSQSLCSGNTETYNVIKTDNVNYQWSLPTGGELTENDNSATIKWTEQGTHTLIVETENECGTGQERTLNVSIKDEVPGINTDIFGEKIICIDSREFYTVPFTEDVVYYWTLSEGGDLVNLHNSAVVDWTKEGRFNLTTTPANNCGEGESVSATIIVENYLSKPEISFSGDSLISTYTNGNQWYFNGKLLSEETKHYIHPIKQGVYKIQTTNSCNTSPFADIVTYREEDKPDYGVIVYPNPANDIVNIIVPVNVEWKKLHIFDSRGNLVNKLENIDCYRKTLDILQFSPGLYLLKLDTQFGKVVKKLFVN